MSKYAGVECLTIKEGSDFLEKQIRSNEPFLAARVGETELGTIRSYKNPLRNINDFKMYSNTVCTMAGFFPKNPIMINRFCKVYLEAMNKIDYYGHFHWKEEEKYASECRQIKICYPAAVYDALADDVSWMKALENKRVLVVHPFAATIEKQYKKREALFPDKDYVLPQFDLITYKAVQSLGGEGNENYRTWFDALESMKSDINRIDFDIALLACGAYGVPLAAHIKDMRKQAIYVGGCLQLMFGIMGKRWEQSDFVTRYINDSWVKPAKEENGTWAVKVEDGCYW